jgi:hypothetical protein
MQQAATLWHLLVSAAVLFAYLLSLRLVVHGVVSRKVTAISPATRNLLNVSTITKMRVEDNRSQSY